MIMDWNTVPSTSRAPAFDNLLAILQNGVPSRPTLFEFYMNDRVLARLAGVEACCPSGSLELPRLWIKAFRNGGYDYATITSWMVDSVCFPVERAKADSVSMSEGGVVTDRVSFDEYPWQDRNKGHYDWLDALAPDVPAGMKLVMSGPGGVLENVTSLVGFESLCLLLADDPELASDIFEAVGSRIVCHYRNSVGHDTVGALISNDDWGFKSQTMLSPADMRKYVFPWHKQIVEICHAAGKPVVLHSCGNLDEVFDDIVDRLGYDGKHSYEDAIHPVEVAYERSVGRIAVMGGIDVDFMCRHSPEEVYNRSVAMLERAAGRGGFALGSGNSIARYVPDAAYFAMLRAALDG